MKQKNIKILLAVSLFPLSILAYISYAIILSAIPVNVDFKSAQSGVDIYVSTNGTHTDLLLPAHTESINWNQKLNLVKPKNSKAEYIAFGWGNKEFYMTTPSWAEFKISTGIKALFWPNSSVMHIKAQKFIPIETENIRRITLSPKQYARLIRYIDNSFRKDNAGHYIPITNHKYSLNHFFYEGTGSYSLFRTCNSWTNSALKESEVRTGFWSPFETGVMYHRK